MRVHVVRADDLLVCDFEFIDIDIDGVVPNRRLIRRGADAKVIVHLPPQHVAEEAFGADSAPEAQVLARSRMAGPTRLVFRVPPGPYLPIDFTLEAILELLTSTRLAVTTHAVRSHATASGIFGIVQGVLFFLSAPPVARPRPDETAIELPFRLILSPDEYAGFAHAVAPVTDPSGRRAELWHTRLQPSPGLQAGAEDEAGRRVRAVWMYQGDGIQWDPERPRWQDHFLFPDPPIGDDEPFPVNAMSQRDRHDIVHASANWRYTRQTGQDYIPRPVDVRRLALSSLGAWLDSRGDWSPPEEYTSLLQWTHRATQGRDHFVRLVYAGYLYPFGHRATKIVVTERTFADQMWGRPPLLRQRTFIVVREPQRSYSVDRPAERRHTMPLSTVRFHTLVTPDLADPLPGPEESDNCHVIRALGSTDPFPFALTGIDAKENRLDLATPLVWLNSTEAWNPQIIDKARVLYVAADGHELDAHGRPLALAPSPRSDTTFGVDRIIFTARPLDEMPDPPREPANSERPRENRPPGFWPELQEATIRVPALEPIAGLDTTVSVSYHEMFAMYGLGGLNISEVFAQLHDPVGLDFNRHADRIGALLQPSMRIAGLSRRLGPVGGSGTAAALTDHLAKVAAGQFIPADFFAGANARLFGALDLDQVLWGFTDSDSTLDPDPINRPRIAAEGTDPLVVRLTWEPLLKSYGHNNPHDPEPEDPLFQVTADTAMDLHVTIDTSQDPPRADASATVERFRLNVAGGETTFLRLHVRRIEFRVVAGRKPDVSLALDRIEFVNNLSFVERLRSLIPLDGFSDPPAITTTSQGISSSYSVSIPSLALGMFALQNVSLGAGFAVPFTDVGALTVSFNFCTRAEPFLLTVSMFGGGGFFALTVDPGGVQVLEAALEFGASVTLDLGVAQGGVHVMAGIYFRDDSATGCVLSGYFRIGGNMSVLGLISVSIELMLEFGYKPDGKASGRAELEVEIDLFLFSQSVTIECERTFAGSAGDPNFDALMAAYPDPDSGRTVRPWNQYCQAYA